jgi:hypothetical protein
MGEGACLAILAAQGGEFFLTDTVNVPLLDDDIAEPNDSLPSARGIPSSSTGHRDGLK